MPSSSSSSSASQSSTCFIEISHKSNNQSIIDQKSQVLKTAKKTNDCVFDSSGEDFCSLVEENDDSDNYSIRMNRSTNNKVDSEHCTKNLVQLCGVSSVPCGYCHQNKHANGSVSYGVYFDRLKASDYLKLLNEGWRRSGKHVYKPYNDNSCCPCYSIRLPVSKFQLNKQQRKIWKRTQQLLNPTNTSPTKPSSQSQPRSTIEVDSHILSSISAHLEKAITQTCGHDLLSYLFSSDKTNKRKRTLKSLCEFQVWKNIPKQYFKQYPSAPKPNPNIIVASTHAIVALTNMIQNSKKKVTTIPTISNLAETVIQAFPSDCHNNKDYSIHIHPPTGQIHLWLSPTIAQKRISHTSTKNKSSKNDNINSTLQKFFSSPGSCKIDNDSRFRMSVECVPSHISALQPEVHRLFVEYQSRIHGDKDPFVWPEESRRKRKQNGHDKKDKDVDDDYYEDESISSNALKLEDFDTLYSSYTPKQRKSIYKNYIAFYHFLCESPFPPADGDAVCFHLQYFIHEEQMLQHNSGREEKKRLVAVGVVDVLPTCVSSVYAFYDPDLSKHLELGKLTALYEINWTKEQQRRVFYYLGYYIHSCVKMKYKAQYRPSQLLCLSHYKWVEFEEAKIRIEQFFPKYCPTLYQHQNKKKKHTTNNNLWKDESQAAPQDMRHESNGERSVQTKNTEPFSCHHVKSDKKNVIENLLLDVGGPSAVSARMLTSHDRSMVNPVLNAFVDEICLSVAQNCIIKLSD